MQHVRNFLHLPSADRRLLIQSVFLLGAIRVGLWLLPFKTLRQFVARAAQVTAQVPADRVTWAVTVASRYVPGASCLTQALATQVLLGRFGHPTSLRIGVARGAGGELQAHAWVESRGRIVLGGVEAPVSYTPLPPLDGDGQ